MADADTTKPVLRWLTIPKTIDISSGWGSVNVTASAWDVGLGVASVLIKLDKPFQTHGGGQDYFEFLSYRDSFSDGRSSTHVGFSVQTIPGTYNIVSIVVVDKAGNQAVYGRDDLIRRGLQTSFDVLGVTKVTGTNEDDTLTGTETGNIIDGGTGADVMTGLGGNDTYLIDNPGDRVVEAVGAGRDTVRSYASHALQAGQEIETLEAANWRSTRALSLTGNAYAQTITGNSGNNILDGGGGPDRLIGLSGNDTYIVDDAGDTVVEVGGRGYDTVLTHSSYRLYSGVSIEVLAAADPSATTALSLTGNAYAQTITGNSGNNILDGGGGVDVLVGLGGNDTYRVHHAGDQVFEARDRGYDTILTGVSYVLQVSQEIEALAAANPRTTTALSLTGNVHAQTITGNAGANTLDGGGGVDTLVGLGGDDTYRVDHAGDRVVEVRNGGYDSVLTRVSYALETGQEIEALAAADLASQVALSLTGNAFGQSLTGNAASNVLKGLGGSDTFVFAAALGERNVDRIADFAVSTAPDHDTIQLAGSVFTALAPGGLAASAFKILEAGGTAIDADDRILYSRSTGSLFYDADGSGEAAAVRFAVLDNRAALTHADFLVV